MARFVVMVEGTVIDGLKYKRGAVLNVPSSNNDIKALGAYVNPSTGAAATTSPLYTIPRLRTNNGWVNGVSDLGTLPPYNAVQTADQLGLQQGTGTLPPNSTGPDKANVIVEPVLPVANSEYD